MTSDTKLPDGCPAKSIFDCEYFVNGICLVENDKFWTENGGCARANKNLENIKGVVK